MDFDFIRDDDDPSSSRAHDGAQDAAFARTLLVGGSNPADSISRTRPASAAPGTTTTARVQHVPLLHRPSLLTPADFPRNTQEDFDNDESLGSLSARIAMTSFPSAAAAAAASSFEAARRAELKALRATAAQERQEAAAEAALREEESLRRRQDHAMDEMSALDRGDFFRPNERGEVSPGFAAGLGPGTASRPAAQDVSASTLSDSLAQYKTRDVFASHARRMKTTRERIVDDALHSVHAGGHRPHLARPLASGDFPPQRKEDKGYHAGPGADPSSRAHPDVRLGLDRLRPTAAEARVESAVAALSAAHMARRLTDQRVSKNVSQKVAEFAAVQERRDEETVRRLEEPYRKQIQLAEAERAPAAIAAKMRPVSAPMLRASGGGSHRASSAKKHSTHAVPAVTDARKAISHSDVQLLAEQAKANADAELAANVNLPAGFSQRPSTAQRLKNAGRYAGAAAASSPSHASSHGHGIAQEHDCAECGGQIDAIVLKHQHRPGSAALSQFAPAAPRSAALSASSVGGSDEIIPSQALSAIESHFAPEAWSQSRRTEGEIDALSRDFEAALARKACAEEATDGDEADESSMVFEDSIAGATAARMKHELKKSERKRERDEKRQEAERALAAQRESLALKTDIWGSEKLGIVALGETAADHTLVALRGKAAALGKVGASLGKTPSHSVAFNSSVIPRRENPAPKIKAAVKVEEPPPPVPAPEPEVAPKRGRKSAAAAEPPPQPAAPKRASSSKKASVVSRSKPASISATLVKAQSFVGSQASTHAAFIDQLLSSPQSKTAAAEIAANASKRSGTTPSYSFSAFRGEQDPESRERRQKRPFSASASLANLGVDALAPASASAVVPAASPAGATSATRMRPSSAALLGHALAHPGALLKTAKARATAASNVLEHVHGHVHQSDGMRLVEEVKERMAHALSHAHEERDQGDDHAATQARLRVSRATLERALIAPHITLDPQQQKKLLPNQLAGVASHPFPEPPKKKKKKGRKGSSSKKKKNGGSSSKKSAKTAAEAPGLGFPPGSSPAEHASNALLSDLPLICLDDLLSGAAAKESVRSVLLRHAASLALVFECFSRRVSSSSSGTSSSGPALMSQLHFWQLLHICGVFAPAHVSASGSSAASAGAVVASRRAYEILCDDEDLSVERLDVDELLSRPAWLERLVRIAVAKCSGARAASEAATPVDPSAVAPALDTFLQRFLLPHALSASPSDLRLRILAEPVQRVLQTHSVALQTLFSHYAADAEGTVGVQQVRQMCADCDVGGAAMDGLEQALQSTLPQLTAAELRADTGALFFPEFLELLCRLASVAQPSSSDLATLLAPFLQRAWNTFSARVPGASAAAAAIAAAHAAHAAYAAPADGHGTPRDTRVQFATGSRA